jgi:7-cyano-7-deazaguanine synthase|tara:strand:+ start:105 stop:932 length:828 start_codon:yes stop_codon:yes gene_type:complete
MQLEINHSDFESPKHAVVSLSGGMDSSTLLLRCLEKFKTVTALSFDYGQKHRVELKRAQALVDYLKRNGHNINYQVIKLDGLVSLLDSALVEGGDEVPEGHYAKDNMKATVVPNRNKIFTSISQAVALSIANRTEENTVIALGIHAGDHSIYPDCRQEFRDADDKAFREGNWDAERVSYYTPYLEGNKFTILQDGEHLCDILELGFDEVYARTNTSYKPTPEGWSDYKSASSVERIEAFIMLGRPDPVQYADETGAVDYEIAENHVKQILKNHEG